MAKIAILGSNGQLGYDLIKIFQGTVHTIVPLKRDFLDVEAPEQIQNLIQIKDCDYILNCISYNRVDDAEDLPQKAFQINSFFPRALAQFCKTHGITLFHFSTDYVFDGLKSEAYVESDIKKPKGVYGASKSMGEDFVEVYSEKYFIMRVSSLFGVAGSSGKGGNFIETMLKMAREGKEIKVVADQYMSPTHTVDVAMTVKYFIDNSVNKYGIYHVCNSGSCSWFEFASEIFKQNQLTPDLKPVSKSEFKTKANRPQYSVMNNHKTLKRIQLPDWKTALGEYFWVK